MLDREGRAYNKERDIKREGDTGGKGAQGSYVHKEGTEGCTERVY